MSYEIHDFERIQIHRWFGLKLIMTFYITCYNETNIVRRFKKLEQIFIYNNIYYIGGKRFQYLSASFAQ